MYSRYTTNECSSFTFSQDENMGNVIPFRNLCNTDWGNFNTKKIPTLYTDDYTEGITKDILSVCSVKFIAFVEFFQTYICFFAQSEQRILQGWKLQPQQNSIYCSCDWFPF